MKQYHHVLTPMEKLTVNLLYTVKIVIPLLPEKPSFLLASSGQLDYLGQILKQMGVPYPLLDGQRLPSDVKKVLPPFTMEVRRRIVDTRLTYDILRLDSLPRMRRNEQLELLLKDHFHIEWIASI